MKPAEQPIPRYVVVHARFKVRVDAYIMEAQMACLAAEEMLILHKRRIRKYALAIRNEILSLVLFSLHVRCSMPKSIDRAIRFWDLKLSSVVLDNNASARSYFDVVNGAPALLSQRHFSDKLAKAKAGRLALEVEELAHEDDCDLMAPHRHGTSRGNKVKAKVREE